MFLRVAGECSRTDIEAHSYLESLRFLAPEGRIVKEKV
jgi:hypothetical protein